MVLDRCNARADAGLAQEAASAVEQRHLLVGLAGLIIAGGGEMRHQAFEFDVLGAMNGRGDGGRIFARAQTPHAAIDFQVVADRAAARGGDAVQARR